MLAAGLNAIYRVYLRSFLSGVIMMRGMSWPTPWSHCCWPSAWACFSRTLSTPTGRA